jgi:hypothetical protein
MSPTGLILPDRDNKKKNKKNKNIKRNSELFLTLGNIKTWSSPKVNSRAFAFHNTHTRSSPAINTLSEHTVFADNATVELL